MLIRADQLVTQRQHRTVPVATTGASRACIALWAVPYRWDGYGPSRFATNRLHRARSLTVCSSPVRCKSVWPNPCWSRRATTVEEVEKPSWGQLLYLAGEHGEQLAINGTAPGSS